MVVENAGDGSKAQTGDQGSAGSDGAAAGGQQSLLDPATGKAAEGKAAGDDKKVEESAEAKAARETKEAADAAGKKKFEGGKESLKVPDGSPLALGRLDKIVADAKARGLSVSETQALVDQEHGSVSAFMDSERARIKSVADGWVSEIKSHPTLGGDKFNETLAFSHDAVKKFGSDKLVEILNTTGLGNHPLMVEFTRNIGAALKDDKFVHGGAESGSAGKTIGELFTGKKPEDWKK